MKKEFYNIEVVNVVAAVNEMLKNENKAKAFPIKFRWTLKKNMAVLEPTSRQFMEFRDQMLKEVQTEYSTEDKSHKETITDDEGKEQEVLKVNEEYIEEYNGKINDLNKKLQELLAEKNEYEIHTIDLDKFVESLPDDTPLEFDDINILSFMDGKEGE